MTSFQAPILSRSKDFQNTFLFSDFVTDVGDFGWVFSNSPQALLTISNGNSDDCLGTATIGAPATSTNLYGRSGIYMAVGKASNVDRAWLALNAPVGPWFSFESRLKSNVTSADVGSVVGFAITHNGNNTFGGRLTRMSTGIGFQAFGDEELWNCAVIHKSGEILFLKSTGIKKNSFVVLNVEWRWVNKQDRVIQAVFSAGGKEIASWQGFMDFDNESSLTPQVEVRDKTGSVPSTGCGRSDQTLVIDYMSCNLNHSRTA